MFLLVSVILFTGAGVYPSMQLGEGVYPYINLGEEECIQACTWAGCVWTGGGQVIWTRGVYASCWNGFLFTYFNVMSCEKSTIEIHQTVRKTVHLTLWVNRP